MYKVLVVEDEKDMAEALEDKLKDEGFEVLRAEDYDEAMKVAFAEKPDGILLDLILPGEKGGLNFLEDIRKDEWGKGVPILILTNVDNIQAVSTAVEHESSDYIVKSEATLDEVIFKLKERMHI